MNVVLSLNTLTNFTGSELYVHDLAIALHKRGFTVTVLANTYGGEIASNLTQRGIRIYPFFDHPELTPDIVHSSQPLPTSYCLRTFPKARHVQTLHSQFSYEQPIDSAHIRAYICVRPQIKDQLPEELRGKATVIYNGVDTTRFNENYEKHEHKQKIVLFVGTYDHLRKNVINDLIKKTIAKDQKLWIVTNGYKELKDKLPSNVVVHPPTAKIEHFTKQCDATASIFVGRTTIEGWMCGKPGWVYNVDSQGAILDCALYDVPGRQARQQFDIENMTTSVIKLYKKL